MNPGRLSSPFQVLPALERLSTRLASLGGTARALSWEQIEEALMLPLQPARGVPGRGERSTGGGGGILGGGGGARRWVRQDLRVRR